MTYSGQQAGIRAALGFVLVCLATVIPNPVVHGLLLLAGGMLLGTVMFTVLHNWRMSGAATEAIIRPTSYVLDFNDALSLIRDHHLHMSLNERGAEWPIRLQLGDDVSTMALQAAVRVRADRERSTMAHGTGANA